MRCPEYFNSSHSLRLIEGCLRCFAFERTGITDFLGRPSDFRLSSFIRKYEASPVTPPSRTSATLPNITVEAVDRTILGGHLCPFILPLCESPRIKSSRVSKCFRLTLHGARP